MPIRRRASGAEHARKGSNNVETPVWKAGQICPRCLRHFIAAEVTPSRWPGLGATLVNLARPLELSVAQGVEAASRFRLPPNKVGEHVARERGSGDATREKSVKFKWQTGPMRYGRRPEVEHPPA